MDSPDPVLDDLDMPVMKFGSIYSLPIDCYMLLSPAPKNKLKIISSLIYISFAIIIFEFKRGLRKSGLET